VGRVLRWRLRRLCLATGDARVDSSTSGAFGIVGLVVHNIKEISIGNSFIAGGTAGINMQVGGIVAGAEGEVGYLNLHGSLTQGGGITQTAMGSTYGVIAGRLGIALDGALLYAKAGPALIDASLSLDAPGISISGSKMIVAPAVGGGLELALGGNWSAKAEYLFLDIHSSFTPCGPSAAGLICEKDHVPGIHTAKIGLNYRFPADRRLEPLK
jgi:outer membrane immunogenic protein